MKKELEDMLMKLDLLITQLEQKETSKGQNDFLVLFLGSLVELICSKHLFKRNSDVVNFLEKNFNIELAEYCKKSRTLIIGKIVRYFLDELDDFDVKENLNFLYSFILKVLEGKQDEITWADVIKSIKL